MFSLFTNYLAKQSVMFVFKTGNRNSTVDYIFTKKYIFSNMNYRFYFVNIWALLSVDVTESVFTISCIAEIHKVENYICSWLKKIYINYKILSFSLMSKTQLSENDFRCSRNSRRNLPNQRQCMRHVAACNYWLIVKFCCWICSNWHFYCICGPEIFREVKYINYMF